MREELEEVNRKLTTGEIYIPPEGQRSPSPDPVYDASGNRLNTREIRAREKLVDSRHRLVEDLIKEDPTFRPPADYKPRKFTHKVYIPFNEYPTYKWVTLLVVRLPCECHAPPCVSGSCACSYMPCTAMHEPAHQSAPMLDFCLTCMQGSGPHFALCFLSPRSFIGLIIGPRGNTQKRMQTETRTKIAIRGKGSLKEGIIKNPSYDYGEDEPLHVMITGDTKDDVSTGGAMGGGDEQHAWDGGGRAGGSSMHGRRGRAGRVAVRTRKELGVVARPCQAPTTSSFLVMCRAHTCHLQVWMPPRECGPPVVLKLHAILHMNEAARSPPGRRDSHVGLDGCSTRCSNLMHVASFRLRRPLR